MPQPPPHIPLPKDWNVRIKDARLARIPARQRPHYPPTERLAILALKTARGWSAAQTARRFLLSAAYAWERGPLARCACRGSASFPKRRPHSRSSARWSRHPVDGGSGAIGRYGSIAVAERFILSMKNELTRRILVPLSLARMRSELVRFFDWYNTERPHEFLDGATPVEVLLRRHPVNKRPRLEPRSRYPADARCAAPDVRASEVGCVLKLVVSGPQHLPVVRLKKAA